MLNDTLIRFIRTYVPVAVGGFIAWLSMYVDLVGVDKDGATTIAVGIVIGLYYLVASILVKVHPIFGWLLGNPKTPVYTPPKNAIETTGTETTYVSNDG